MKEEYIRFGTIRKYCSRIDRVSVCEIESGNYENFEYISQVPERYDRLYLYGIGIIDGDFRVEGKLWFTRCIEFMLSKEPRTDLGQEGVGAENAP